jgi:hypothetical protein
MGLLGQRKSVPGAREPERQRWWTPLRLGGAKEGTGAETVLTEKMEVPHPQALISNETSYTRASQQAERGNEAAARISKLILDSWASQIVVRSIHVLLNSKR